MFEPTYDIQQLKEFSPKVTNTTVIIGTGGLPETINAIVKIINYNYKKIVPFAEKLQGENLEQTAFNIWHFMRNETTYLKDAEGKEELRTPQRLISEKFGDCDDYSIFSASVLKALGYNPFLYIVAFNNSESYGHIYTGIDNTVIDGVMNEFNQHPDGITKTMIVNLNGKRKEFLRSPKLINITDMLLQQLSGIPYSEQTEIINTEFERLSGLSGLNDIETENYNKIRTLKLLEGDGLRQFVSELLPVARVDNEMNIYFTDQETANEIDSFYDEFQSISGLGDVDGLGKLFEKLRAKVKAVNTKIKDKIKNDFEKFKSVASKVSDAVKKVSFAPARGALLLLLKVNLFGWASRLWLSYLPENKISEYDIEPEPFKKLVEFRKSFENFWEKAGGDKKAIFAAVSGRGQKKAIEKLNGLGFLPAVAAAPAAASPFLVFLGKAWGAVKGIFKNLFKKGGLKEKAGKLKEIIGEFKEGNKETDALQEDLLAKEYDGGGSGLPSDTNTDPDKKSLLVPAAIAAALLFSIF
jgi:hypothetical protein